MKIIITKHFQERLDERYSTNNIKGRELVIDIFKKAYKDIKKKKKHYKLTKKVNHLGETFTLFCNEFKFVYAIHGTEIYLITFRIRKSLNDLTNLLGK